MCVAHQIQCLCQQKDLPCLEEMAQKDSNDLSPFTFVMELIALPLSSVVSPIMPPFYFLKYSVLTLFLTALFSALCLSVCAGGRGVVVGPIVSQSLSDVFCDNEYGPNFLFRNNGDGTFTDVAQQAGERNKFNNLVDQFM